MKKAILSLITLSALTLTALAIPAKASIITAIDNTTLTPNNGKAFTTFAEAIVFQTGPNSASINSLTFKFQIAGSSLGTFAAYLYAVDADNMPTGAPLASQTGMAFTLPGPAGYYNVTYTGADITNLSSITMLAGQKYALALTNKTGGQLWWAYRDGSTLGDYTTGDGYSVLAIAESFSGGDWLPSSNMYMLKLETGSAATVPEPSTYALLCISLGVVGYARKRMKKDEERMVE